MYLEMLRERFWQSIIFTAVLTAFVTFLGVNHMQKDRTTLVVEDIASPDTPKSIYVDLAGAVVRPGVYKLDANARIVDVLDLGGGFLDTASGTWLAHNLNLSAKLTDAQKVYIPFDWDLEEYISVDLIPISFAIPQATVSSSPGDVISTKINVNNASKEDLETLTRVGEVTAQKIIDNRPYIDLISLGDKAGLSENLLNNIKNLIVF